MAGIFLRAGWGEHKKVWCFFSNAEAGDAGIVHRAR